MSKLIAEKINDVFLKVHCEDSVAQELRDKFTFTVPNYQYDPRFKAGVWDGKIRLYNTYTKRIYAGLTKYLDYFCQKSGYEISYAFDTSTKEWSSLESQEFAHKLNLPMKPYEEQLNVLTHGIRNSRVLFVSPTASGKSLMIYMLVMHYRVTTLIIVPTLNLIHQMKDDFKHYGYKGTPHLIYEGQDLNKSAGITISTWQSIYQLKESWFSKFRIVIGDEAHLYKATSLKTIMEKLTNCPYRFGFTGTLDGTETNQMVLEGLFGPVKLVTTTKKLIQAGKLSTLTIKIIVLNHNQENCKRMYYSDWHDELDYLFSYEPRNKFIRNLTLSLEGNTLLLFRYVDKHGKILYNMIKGKTADNRKVFFIHGAVPGEERNEIRAIVEKEKNAIIIASEGTFSTGINIKNLHNIIKSASSRGRILNLQSIGRGLRKGDNKDNCTWFDIADNLTYKGKLNHTLNHLYERIKLYSKEGFDYKIYRVGIK